MFCAKCGFQFDEDKTVCPQCGCSVEESAQTAVSGNAPIPQPELPMKWFKFLIYFSLFANAVINVYNGISYITGLLYGQDAEIVYEIFSGLKTVDMVFGVLSIALAAFAVFTRFRLSKFCKNGPVLLHLVYAANCVLGLLYAIGVAAVMPEYMSVTEVINVSQLVSSFVVSGVMIAINVVYFNKRKHLFVN